MPNQLSAMPNQLSEPEWLLVRDAMGSLNAPWDDEQVLGLGLVRILKRPIEAEFVSIGCADLGAATHRLISDDEVPDAWQEALAVLRRKTSLLNVILASSGESARNREAGEGYPYSDLARPLLLDGALGVILPVWPCSALIDLLVTPAQRDQFSGSQREMLNLLIPHIGEAFRRTWTGGSFSTERQFRPSFRQG